MDMRYGSYEARQTVPYWQAETPKVGQTKFARASWYPAAGKLVLARLFYEPDGSVKEGSSRVTLSKSELAANKEMLGVLFDFLDSVEGPNDGDDPRRAGD